MSRGSRAGDPKLSEAVPGAWQRLLRSRAPVAASASVSAGGAEMPVDVVAQVEFLDDRRVDVHLALAEPDEVAAPEPRSVLTGRERAVVALIAQGLETRQIADALYVSPETVKSHVRNAMDKLGVHTRAQMVAVVLSGGDAYALHRSGDSDGEKSPMRGIVPSSAQDDQ